MPISKKAKIQREHKAAEKAGTRAPVKANGLPVKAPKPTSIVRSLPPTAPSAPSHRNSVLTFSVSQCANCRKEIINTNKVQLEVHAQTHDQKNWPKEKCWPNDFPSSA
jgi:hypothetical protein